MRQIQDKEEEVGGHEIPNLYVNKWYWYLVGYYFGIVDTEGNFFEVTTWRSRIINN